MRTSFSLLLAVLMLAYAGLATAAHDQWPAPPSRLNLETPYGTLGVSGSDYVYESILVFNGKPVEPHIEGLLNIPYAFSSGRYHAALISIDSGSKSCPVAYQWIVLNSDGYKLSPEFGSCSEQIRVSAVHKTFTLETPNRQNPAKTDVYVFDGKSITQRGQH